MKQIRRHDGRIVSVADDYVTQDGERLLVPTLVMDSGDDDVA